MQICSQSISFTHCQLLLHTLEQIRLFHKDKEYYRNLRFITDIEEPDYTSYEYKEDSKENIDELNRGTFYYRHTKEWNGILPNSLKESIYCYYLANVVRDLRGHGTKPRSMLINMSRFVKGTVCY